MNTGGKIKVLTITTSGLARKEGISTVILDNYSKLDRSKFDLHLIASGEYNYELIQAFQRIGVSIRCLSSRRSSPVEYFRDFIHLVKKERYDVIYIHGSSAIMSIEFFIAKHFGCRERISHSHNTMCDHKIIDKILRPLLYAVITNRIACGQDAGKWLYGNRPFKVIKNGRDPNIYRFNSRVRNKVRKELALKDEQLAIGHVGNFNEQKNQIFLIEIFKKVKLIYPASKLFLMGDGRKRKEIMEKAIEEGFQDEIIFTGSIQNIPEMLQAMDTMVLPSLHEGLPLVVVEWQMAGLPCVISDRVTKECVFSELVSFEKLDSDPEEWAKKILKGIGMDRQNESEKAIVGAKEAGFDLNESALALGQILSCEV